MKVYVTFQIKLLMKQERNVFYKNEQKSKDIFFCHDKLKTQPRT